MKVRQTGSRDKQTVETDRKLRERRGGRNRKLVERRGEERQEAERDRKLGE